MLLSLLLTILIFLSAQAANAQNLGDLTDQPSPITLQGSIPRLRAGDTYTFSLSDGGIVDVQLTELSNNANLHLLDSSGATLASSANSGVANESVQTSLNAGDYSILIEKPGRRTVSYTLMVSAQGSDPGSFTPQDDVVSGTLDIRDPEFDPMTFHVAWGTPNGVLMIAPVNPTTGDFSLGEAVEVDSGLVSFKNGPEWSVSRAGARVLYTKRIDGSRLQVGQAQFQSDSWNPSLVPGTLDGFSAFGNVNPEDLLPVAVYKVGTPSNPQQGQAWKELDSPWVGAAIPDSTILGQGRWLPGGDSIVFAQPLDGVNQLASYDIHSGITTTLTSGPVHKSKPFAARAPDLGNEVVLTAAETDDATGGYDKWIGVYRQLNGVWTRIKQIFSPSAELPAVDSVEPFVFGGKTYISFLAIKDPDTSPNRRRRGAAVFIASVDPGDDFVREVSTKSETMVRRDPEPFATNQAAFIYYTEIMANGSGRIHRCATGLEAP